MFYRTGWWIFILAGVALAAFLAGRQWSDSGSVVHGAESSGQSPAAEIGAEPDSSDDIIDRVRTVSAIAPSQPGSPAVAPVGDLPDADVPVVALIDELDERARRGDPRAACRLGMELMRCRKARQQANIRELLQSAVQQRDHDIADFEVDLLAKMEDRHAASERRCEGVGPEQWNRAVEFQRIAAERGDARMRLWYVAEPALDPSFFLDDLEEWARYRAVARRYLDEALQAGLSEAPEVLARVHLPADAVSVPGVLREPDAHLHFVYAELDRMLNPKETSSDPPPAGWYDPAPKPGPDIDMAAVRADAERLRLAWFAAHDTSSERSGPSSDASFGSDPEKICAGIGDN
jgi:hypothetical protein